MNSESVQYESYGKDTRKDRRGERGAGSGGRVGGWVWEEEKEGGSVREGESMGEGGLGRHGGRYGGRVKGRVEGARGLGAEV